MSDVFAPYARDAALSMEFAYDALIEDLEREMAVADGAAVAPLQRLLARVRERRAAIGHLTAIVQSSKPQNKRG